MSKKKRYCFNCVNYCSGESMTSCGMEYGSPYCRIGFRNSEWLENQLYQDKPQYCCNGQRIFEFRTQEYWDSIEEYANDFVEFLANQDRKEHRKICDKHDCGVETRPPRR